MILDENFNNIIGRISDIKKVKAIYIFGSQVNGRARKDSDVDIAVLTKGMSRNEELEIIGFGDDDLDISVFDNLPLVIQFRVLKEGKLLFCRDEKAVYDTRVRVFKQYLDFSYYLNNFYRRVLGNV